MQFGMIYTSDDRPLNYIITLEMLDNAINKACTFAPKEETAQRSPTKKMNLKKLSSGQDDSDEFQLEHHQIKRLKLPINKSRLNSGSWTDSENLIYLKYLKENKSKFETEDSRRKSRVFYILSKKMKRRNPDQCRSHHQKLQLKYQSNIDLLLEDQFKKFKIQYDINQFKCKDDKQKRDLKTGQGLEMLQAADQHCQNQTNSWYNIFVNEQTLLIKIDFGEVASI